MHQRGCFHQYQQRALGLPVRRLPHALPHRRGLPLVRQQLGPGLRHQDQQFLFGHRRGFHRGWIPPERHPGPPNPRASQQPQPGQPIGGLRGAGGLRCHGQPQLPAIHRRHLFGPGGVEASPRRILLRRILDRHVPLDAFRQLPGLRPLRRPHPHADPFRLCAPHYPGQLRWAPIHRYPAGCLGRGSAVHHRKLGL